MRSEIQFSVCDHHIERKRRSIQQRLWCINCQIEIVITNSDMRRILGRLKHPMDECIITCKCKKVKWHLRHVILTTNTINELSKEG
jgi:hypothetical protein